MGQPLRRYARPPRSSFDALARHFRNAGRVVPSGTPHSRHGKHNRRRIISLAAQRNPIQIARTAPFSTLAGSEIGRAGCENLFRDLAAVLARVGVAPSTLATYSGGWKIWAQFRQAGVGKPLYLDPSVGSDSLAHELASFVAYLYFSRGNKLQTVVGRLSAIQYFHKLEGIELPLTHYFLRAVKSGLNRESTQKGEGPRIRRPLTWVILRQGHNLISSWGDGGTVLWLSLCISYFFLCRASELFAYSNGKIHKYFGLTRGDVAFKRRGTQLLKPSEWHSADCVELRFRAHKGDQKRLGAVINRTRASPQPTPHRPISVRF